MQCILSAFRSALSFCFCYFVFFFWPSFGLAVLSPWKKPCVPASSFDMDVLQCLTLCKNKTFFFPCVGVSVCVCVCVCVFVCVCVYTPPAVIQSFLLLSFDIRVVYSDDATTLPPLPPPPPTIPVQYSLWCIKVLTDVTCAHLCNSVEFRMYRIKKKFKYLIQRPAQARLLMLVFYWTGLELSLRLSC